MRLFFASDLHGSEPCFRKFINAARHYNAQVLVLGGDLAGKAVLPIVEQGNGRYRTRFLEQDVTVSGSRELSELEKRARAFGFYPRRVTPDQAEVLANSPPALEDEFAKASQEFFTNWFTFAEERLPPDVECYVIAGNDDDESVVLTLKTGTRIKYVEGQKVLVAGEMEMISVGQSNRTPWDSPREVDDIELGHMVANLADQIASPKKAIFNTHCPPLGTALDLAPEIDREFRVKAYLGQPQMIHVGSAAIREAIEKYQPLLGLHGHCHESRGIERIGATACINPGSEYSNGVLRGVVVTISGNGSNVQHQFVSA
jgi:uncharacterized protein